MPFSEKIARIYLNRRGSSSLNSSARTKKKATKSDNSQKQRKIEKSNTPSREISNLSEIPTESNKPEIAKEMSELSIERFKIIL